MPLIAICRFQQVRKQLHSLGHYVTNVTRCQSFSAQRYTSTYAYRTSDDYFHINMLSDSKEGIAVMSMRHSKGLNSLGYSFMKQFQEAMNELKLNNQVRILVLRSEIKNIFCAGADLKERLTMPIPETYGFVTMLRNSFMELHNLPMPTIAAIDGAALGGGLEMALACDLRVAASNAKIGLVETSHAILPGAGGTQRLPRIVGVAVAKELILTSRRLNGWQALEKGVVNDCVDQNEGGDAAYHRAIKLAEEILPNGPIALRLAKAAINRGSEVELETGMRFEEAYYAQVIPTKDRMEGLVAFKEKRKPKYQGH